MHKILAKIRLLYCPFCGNRLEPDEFNVENWKCMDCNRVWFIKLIG
jgi:ribosomal protein L37AE/L43A